MASVQWTVPAKHHLRSVYDFIAQDSPFYAKKVTDDIVTQSERLALFPRSGRIVPELQDDAIRELLVSSYRLIYGILDEEAVVILALVHSKRDLSGGLPQ